MFQGAIFDIDPFYYLGKNSCLLLNHFVMEILGKKIHFQEHEKC